MTRNDFGLPGDDGALRALLRDALVVAPPPSVAAQHIDAAVHAANAPVYAVPPAARRHRSSKLRSPFAVRAVVVAVVSSMTMTLGLAEAGALPRPVQQIVVDVGRFAGVHFPTEKSNAVAPEANRPAIVPSVVPEPPTTVHPRAAVATPTTAPPATPPTTAAHTTTRATPAAQAPTTTTPPKPPVTTHPPVTTPPTTPTPPPVVGGGPPPPVIGGGNHHPPHGGHTGPGHGHRGHHPRHPRRHRPPHHRVRPQS